jgi:hypothetical protein
LLEAVSDTSGRKGHDVSLMLEETRNETSGHQHNTMPRRSAGKGQFLNWIGAKRYEALFLENSSELFVRATQNLALIEIISEFAAPRHILTHYAPSSGKKTASNRGF